MQATFLVDPPPGIADQLKGLIGDAKRRFGWTRVANPSNAQLEVALAASPYLMSVLFCHGELMLAGVSDAAEDLSIVVTEEAWNNLRPDLEEILGTPLRFDTAELNDPF
jgi:hypothetical protein